MNAEKMNPTPPQEMDEVGRRTSRTKSKSLAAAARVAKIPPQPIEKISCRQKLLSSQYILAKVFRKDGPSLGFQFDHLPSPRRSKGTTILQQKGEEESVGRKRKVSTSEDQDCGVVVKKKQYGIGKGLMTAWRVMNPNCHDRAPTLAAQTSPPHQNKKKKKNKSQLASILKQKLLQKNKKKSPEKRRNSMNTETTTELNKDETAAFNEKCELGEVFKETCQTISILVDDEDLERQEGLVNPPLTCSCHTSATTSGSCFLCKDHLLPKFPPNSVGMRLPFALHPWNSSPESVKKLFKVVHFLYTYSVTLETCPFTIDQFTRAFHHKDSLLLGKIHLSLLKLLLLDVETELQRGSFSSLTISCKFLALLQSVESQNLLLDMWKDSLNSLTWAEILRQILVAAGFGSVKRAVQSEELSKERRLMKKYGLRLGTLKGELFSVLNERGKNGLKISELANAAAEVAALNLATASSEERERSICSTLASDITIFEKISESTYRVRVNCFSEDHESDSGEESGSVDDESGDEIERVSESRKAKCRKRRKMLEVCSEIDESHPGEPWLLGLMEGEYSDLSIEEKLDVFMALIDLLSSGSTIRIEDLPRAMVDCVPSIYSHGSGGKIKRASSSNQYSYPRVSWVHGGGERIEELSSTSSDSQPVDSSSIVGAFTKLAGDNVHPMQSVYLGSDRRFNRYWLFLGPCNPNDPGHRCVYFESSEDGHWEVISHKEALRALLSVLDDRGRREARLIESLEKRESFLCQAMLRRIDHLVREDSSSSSPISDIDNNNLCLNEIANDQQQAAIVFEIGSKREKSRLVQEFDEWIWDNYYLNLSAVKHSRRSYLDSLTRCKSCHDLYWRDEKHCKICHGTFELDVDLEERYAIHAATCSRKNEESSDSFPDHKVLSSQLQSLKAAVYAIESAMPEDSLIGAWKKSAHRLWAKRLRRSSTLSEITQVIGDFVGAINEDWLWHFGEENALMGEIITSFPSMPRTTSAIALWLVKLDTLIAPYVVEKAQPGGNRL